MQMYIPTTDQVVSTSRSWARGLFAALLAGSVTFSASAQEVLLKEDFNTDGKGTRYDLEGAGKSEFADHPANGVSADQQGPVYWARNTEVSIVGVPGPTPARRALLVWDGAIAKEEIDAKFFTLFDATVKWLTKDKAKLTVVFSPNVAVAQSLADRLTAGGHTVLDDDTTVAESALAADLAIKGPGGSNPSRFATTKVPVLTFSDADHDDMLVSTIGSSATFEAGDANITTANHPAAGGLTGNFKVATGSHTWRLMGDSLPQGAITVAELIRLVPPNAANLGDVDAMAAGTKQSIKTTATASEIDFNDATPGDWPIDNLVPGNATGIWGMTVAGKLNVGATGRYSFALAMDDGARLRIDKDKNGFGPNDNVINEDAAGGHRARYGDLQLDAGTYDFQITAFNSGGAGSLEFSVSTKPGGQDTSAILSGSWEIVALGSFGAVKLAAPATVTSYVPSGPPTEQKLPFLVLLNGPDEGGTVYGGGAFTRFEGSGYFAGAALNKFTGADGIGTPKVLQLKPVNVAGKPNLKLTVAVAATFLDFETSDFLDFKVGEAGSDPSTFQTLARFTAPSGSVKYFDDRGTRPANPTRLGLTFQDVTYDIPAGFRQLVLRVEANTTWWNEIVGFDNIRITSGDIVVAKPTVGIKRDGANVVLEFAGVLQSAPAITGPWTDVANAKSPLVLDRSQVTGTSFLRARQ